MKGEINNIRGGVAIGISSSLTYLDITETIFPTIEISDNYPLEFLAAKLIAYILEIYCFNIYVCKPS